MKFQYVAALGLGLLALQAYAADSQSSNLTNVLKTDSDKTSYTIGVDIGENLQAQSIKINPDVLTQGIKDGISGGPLLMNKDEMQQTIAALQKKLIDEQRGKLKEQAQKNEKAGADFLAKNKQNPGVVTLPSGLQYKIIEAGKGEKPVGTDFVTVDYEGKLLNGNIFDSSYQRGKPVNFQLSKIIKGWQEALQKMPVGSTWELYIPSNLGYGEHGSSGVIEPNQTLIFKVHLISIGQEKVLGNDKNAKAVGGDKSM